MAGGAVINHTQWQAATLNHALWSNSALIRSFRAGWLFSKVKNSDDTFLKLPLTFSNRITETKKKKPKQPPANKHPTCDKEQLYHMLSAGLSSIMHTIDQNLSCSFKGNQQPSFKPVLQLHLKNKQVYLKLSFKKCHILINRSYKKKFCQVSIKGPLSAISR